MANKKNTNTRLAELEAQKKAADRQAQRSRRWQQIAIIGFSVIVLVSMVLSLLFHP